MAKLEADIFRVIKDHPVEQMTASLSFVLITLCVNGGIPKEAAFEVMSKEWDRIEAGFLNHVKEQR